MNLEQVLLSHFQYLNKATAFLEGEVGAFELVSSDECPVGEWLRDHPNSKIADLHMQFHALIEEVFQSKQSGQIERAKEALDQAYTLYSQIEFLLLKDEKA